MWLRKRNYRLDSVVAQSFRTLQSFSLECEPLSRRWNACLEFDLFHDALDVVIWRTSQMKGLACQILDVDGKASHRLGYSPIHEASWYRAIYEVT